MYSLVHNFMESKIETIWYILDEFFKHRLYLFQNHAIIHLEKLATPPFSNTDPTFDTELNLAYVFVIRWKQ